MTQTFCGPIGAGGRTSHAALAKAMMDVGISTVKPVPRVDVAAVAALIRDTQLESGEIPWHTGGKTDPWDHVEAAMKRADLEGKRLSSWSDDDILSFVRELRRLSKPMVIAANKADIEESRDNIRRMQRELEGYVVVPTSAEAELALRRAARAGLIRYLPGDSDFEVVEGSKLTRRQERALEYIRERVLRVWGSTGVQQVINEAFLGVLRMVVVFPVEDENRFTDHEGNVLPDALLVPPGTKPRDLAYMIHTELGEGFIAALDARTKMRIPSDQPLKHRSVVKIYARK